ncbi:hypothetical protein [Streptomyces caatingaensis]|uniref:Uncharacterized protein n=1 Tax=Streptomyces caatingaensis TaxID=1678637 RepID=A0A0K9XJK5_9ACTN|nr:hypothetical protein [Streptomyces caatingaensis]KNB53493.1 hypothetical protein AC230_02160 [Streptomyces caatingaensis]
MLIRQAEFDDARKLTGTLVNDPNLWSTTALLVEDGLAHNADRLSPLLAAWSQIAVAATGASGPPFAGVTDPEARWVHLGRDLCGAACQGEPADITSAAERCTVELAPDERVLLVEHLGKHVSDTLRLAGGLEELLEQDKAHEEFAAAPNAGWVSAAAWAICALTEMHHAEADRAITRLVADEGHGASLWRTWAQVAASIMSPEYLKHLTPFPQDSATYPVGLPQRAVEAVHGTTRMIKRAQAEFAAQSQDDQVMLAFELAMMIAAVRAQPARKAARQAERVIGHAPLDAEQEAMRSVVGSLMDELPDGIVERTGRMHALSRRAVLAFIDEDAQTLAAVVDRIASWDDDPGRLPYPQPRFQFASRQALALANDLFYQAETHGAHISNRAAAGGAGDLIARHAPAEHRAAAQRLLTAMNEDGRDAEFSPTAGDEAPGLLAFAATAAWLCVHPKVHRSRESARLALIQEIRESEAKALKTPDREMINEISDQDALHLLGQLYDGDYPLPRDAGERAVWEADIIAVAKQHLLETPADATTPEQKAALCERVSAILRAAEGTPRRTPPPPDRTGVVRTQPKRTPKRKRKGK